MSDDRVEALERLAQQSSALLRAAQHAAQLPAVEGTDESASVTATLDGQGRVTAVAVSADWRQHLDDGDLPAAVATAVRDAAASRLARWGQAFSGSQPQGASGPAGGRASAPVTGPAGLDPVEVQRQLQALAKKDLSPQDRVAALTELLELFQAIERGLDEVSGKLAAVTEQTHTGHSPGRRIAVTVTGGGDFVSVHIDRSWLRHAPATAIGRQIMAAFTGAYTTADTHGVTKLIADSPLGHAHQATQDPFGLARRLRLAD